MTLLTLVLLFGLSQASFFSNEDHAKIFKGDIKTTPRLRKFYRNFNGERTQIQLWPDGIIPFKFGMDNQTKKEWTYQAIKMIEDSTCLQIVPWNGEDEYYVNIKEGHENSCSSFVGRTHRGGQEMNVRGCSFMGMILHEFMHAIGFIHEQERPDRDEHVDIMWHNVDPNNDEALQKDEFFDVPYLDYPYDLCSVTHYSRFTGTRHVTYIYPNGSQINEGGPTIQIKKDPKDVVFCDPEIDHNMNKGPSEMDAIKINGIYKCKGFPTLLDWRKKHAGKEVIGPNFRGDKSCNDKEKHCKYWAGEGYCREDLKFAKYMQTFCKKSCGLC